MNSKFKLTLLAIVATIGCLLLTCLLVFIVTLTYSFAIGILKEINLDWGTVILWIICGSIVVGLFDRIYKTLTDKTDGKQN